jgi:hypothetical protein
MSVAGKWDGWYEDVETASVYGSIETYRLAAEWLARCALVEDWGAGKGGFSIFRDRKTIRGIDGSPTPWADVVTDLAGYSGDCDGLLIRHVLEHNRAPVWQQILGNALGSFRERAAIIVFTPFDECDEECELAFCNPPGVPDLSLRSDEFLGVLLSAGGFTIRNEVVKTETTYGSETIIYLERW